MAFEKSNLLLNLPLLSYYIGHVLLAKLKLFLKLDLLKHKQCRWFLEHLSLKRLYPLNLSCLFTHNNSSVLFAICYWMVEWVAVWLLHMPRPTTYFAGKSSLVPFILVSDTGKSCDGRLCRWHWHGTLALAHGGEIRRGGDVP